MKPTLWQLLERRAESTPDRVLYIEGDQPTQRRATAQECLRLAEGLAAALYEKGVKPGDVVAWQIPTRLNAIVLHLALSRLGVTQNPILHLYRGKELSDLLGQSKPAWFIVPEDGDYPQLAQTMSELIGSQAFILGDEIPLGDVSRLPPVPTDSTEVKWIYCTSGTTSGAKAVLHTDSSVIAGGLALADAMQATPDDVGSIAYPCTHIGGIMYIVMQLEVGLPAVLVERFKIETVAEIFRREGVTLTGGSTAHYQGWLELQRKHPEEKVLPALRLLAGGGAAKPPQLYFAAVEELGVPILHAYGMTESPLVAHLRWSSTEHQRAYTDGLPVLGMEVKVLKADGSVGSVGEEGEILIRGDCLCKGYLNPKQTAEAFEEDGFYHTGDVGRIDENGYISLTGRIKDIIIRKGENISAREVEEILMEHPKIGGIAVIGLPDEDRGERVCAAVELAEGQHELTLQELSDFLSTKGLMKQKWPEQLEVVDCFPRSEAMGKVAKQQLKKDILSRTAS